MGPLAYTFGSGLTAIVVILWIVVWLFVAFNVLRRRDLGVGGKVIWIVVILVLPVVGLLVYFIWDAASPRRR